MPNSMHTENSTLAAEGCSQRAPSEEKRGNQTDKKLVSVAGSAKGAKSNQLRHKVVLIVTERQLTSSNHNNTPEDKSTRISTIRPLEHTITAITMIYIFLN
jgi:hypothetical protein